ncbi:hypothetical protein Aduo_004674 [Ancylostoma duodenale]
MTEPDLSFIKSDIDLSEVAPLNRRRIVAFVNCYILKMTDFLNDFANRAEGLILESERQLHAVDIKLQLLEAKLAGIPDPGAKQQDSQNSSSVGNAKISTASDFNVSASNAQSRPDPPSSSQQSVAAAPVTAATSVQPPAPANPELAAVEQENVLLVKDDPAFAKYFRMLKLGIVEPAIKQKMQSEGFDPSLLDNPNAPSPNPTKPSDPMNSALSQADDSDSSSVSSFSDSD